MKNAKDILFEKYEVETHGGNMVLPVQSILQAMEEYANEKLTAFMINYIGRGASKFEVQRLLKQFDDENPF